MHNRDFFYDNYKNHPEPTLKRIAGEYSKLTPEAQEALRDVLKERGLEEMISHVAAKPESKGDLSHLSADDVRMLINQRLEKGENPEKIKIDLKERGVNLYNMSLYESRSEENIDRRFMELQSQGKSSEEIHAKLKEEFKLSGEQATKIPDRLRSSGTWFLVAGGVLLLVGIPFFAVMLEAKGKPKLKIPIIIISAGIGLLIAGIMKRRAAAKFIRDSEGKYFN
jgi:hypothetical protein